MNWYKILSPSREPTSIMVCTKCQKRSQTTLATPAVKRKSEMYYGSPASSSTGEKKSATLGQTGISKVPHNSGQLAVVEMPAIRQTNFDFRASCCPRAQRILMRNTQGRETPSLPLDGRGPEADVIFQRLREVQDESLSGAYVLQPVRI
jgi:hypothetical protein